MNNWIKTFKIDEQICKDVIKVFESDPIKETRVPGMSANKIQKHIKDSSDTSFHPLHFHKLHSRYFDAIYPSVQDYAEKANLANFTLEMANVQKYEPGGGFKQLHYERDFICTTRILTFMTYLNDVPGGGTHFPEQDYTAEAKTGNTVIWPCEFTHPHVGQISEEHVKYIITGWFIYVDPSKPWHVQYQSIDSYLSPVMFPKYTILNEEFAKKHKYVE